MGMADAIILKHPPIKEIIFTISFSGSAINLEHLTRFVKLPEMSKQFPSFGHTVSFNVNLQRNQTQTASSASTSADGYILRSPSKVLQIRSGLLSFHRINGYEPFHDLLVELSGYWELFKQVVGTVEVTNLSVRYVNFIDIAETEQLDEFLSVKVEQQPFSGSLSGLFIQYRFLYDKNPKIDANVVISAGKHNSERNGVVLDIILNRKSEDKVGIMDFADMRDAKNDIFFRTITKKTISKYNQ
jgi:uncharacterized protein (TIGR04255 family)